MDDHSPSHQSFVTTKDILLCGGPMDGERVKLQLYPPDGRLTFFRISPQEPEAMERLNYYLTPDGKGGVIAEYSAG